MLSVSGVVVDVDGFVESGVTSSAGAVVSPLDSFVVSLSSVGSTSKVTFESLSLFVVSFSSVFALLFTLDTSGSVNLLITEISSSAPAILQCNECNFSYFHLFFVIYYTYFCRNCKHLKFFYYFTRISCRYYIRRNIFCYYTASTYRCIISNSYTW